MVQSRYLILTFEFVFTIVAKFGRQSENIKRSGLFLPKIDKTQMLQLEDTLKLKYTLSYHYSLKTVVNLLTNVHCVYPQLTVKFLMNASRKKTTHRSRLKRFEDCSFS